MSRYGARAIGLVALLVGVLGSPTRAQNDPWRLRQPGADRHAQEEGRQARRGQRTDEGPPPPAGGRLLKKRIAVIPADVGIEQWSFNYGTSSLAEGLSDMMAGALTETGRFVVVEREQLPAITAEIELGEQGLTTTETAPQRGQGIGAEYLIVGKITEFEDQQSASRGGISIAGIRLGGDKAKALVGVDARIFHTATTQVIAAKHVKGKAGSQALDVDLSIGGWDVSGETFRKTPLGQALLDCVTQWVAFVVEELGRQPWEGRVVKADTPDMVYVNGGRNMGVQVGDRFEVYRPGEALVDPTTGLNLGTETELIGLAAVTQVEDLYSIAQTVEAQQPFERNDILREFAGSWPDHPPLEPPTEPAGGEEGAAP